MSTRSAETSINAPLPSPNPLLLFERFFAAHLPPSRKRRFDDVLVAGAAAEIAIETVTNLCLGRVRIVAHELVDGDDHARCAEPALEPVLLPASAAEQAHRMRLLIPMLIRGRYAPPLPVFPPPASHQIPSEQLMERLRVRYIFRERLALPGVIGAGGTVNWFTSPP